MAWDEMVQDGIERDGWHAIGTALHGIDGTSWHSTAWDGM